MAERYYISYRLKQIHFQAGLPHRRRKIRSIGEQETCTNKSSEKGNGSDLEAVREVSLLTGDLPQDVFDTLLDYFES